MGLTNCVCARLKDGTQRRISQYQQLAVLGSRGLGAVHSCSGGCWERRWAGALFCDVAKMAALQGGELQRVQGAESKVLHTLVHARVCAVY